MSFDLCFHSRTQTAIQASDLEDYFRGLKVFTPQPDGDQIHFHYNNEDTWVYCTFSVPRSGTKDQSLDFRLNYNRPISFPCETFPLVESFCNHFDLLVEDVQEEITAEANVGRLVDSWRVHNVGAVQALAAAGSNLRYFPESKSFEWWRYTRVRNQIDAALAEEMFVPLVVFLESPEKLLFRMFVLPEGTGQLLPPSDYVWVQRNASANGISSETDTGFVSYEEIIDRLGPHLDDYKAFGETIKYISPANAQSAVPIIRNLDLRPVDLSTHKGFPANGFHNVELDK